jgi:Cell wall-active antibiotics response 4TMS YvqF
VNDDGPSAETGSPVSGEVQQRGIDFLQGLVASGKVGLDRFHIALDALLEARTQADFASVVRSLPSPVEITPPARRREEPLKIFSSMGDVRLEGRWQVSRLTKIYTGMGSVTIDLSQAEFDDWDVKIVVGTGMGKITVIVPRGFEVRPVGRSGPVSGALEPPIPGFPVVRLSATSNRGAIRLKHPAEKKPRRQRWRRRGKGLPDLAPRIPVSSLTSAPPVLACQGLEARCGSRRQGRRDARRQRHVRALEAAERAERSELDVLEQL